MYTVWIKIDETLPWIELKGEYTTKGEAARAAKALLASARTKIVHIPERKTPMKALATVRVTR